MSIVIITFKVKVSMFNKKKSKNEIDELHERLEELEKTLLLLTASNNKVITEMIEKRGVFDTLKQRLEKVEKEIEKERTGNMYG